MRTVRRKASLLGICALLACGGVGIGALASSLTSSAVVWRAPPQIPMTDGPVESTIDQAAAGQAWARAAFDGGLRKCPKMNARFLIACQTEMEALVDRPAFAYGSYGGPLLVTKIEPVAPPSAFEPYVSEEPPAREAEWERASYDAEPPLPAAAVPQAPTPLNYPTETGHEIEGGKAGTFSPSGTAPSIPQ